MQILASNHVDAVVLYWTALLPATGESGTIEGVLSGIAIQDHTQITRTFTKCSQDKYMLSSMEHADESSEIIEILNAYHTAMVEARSSDLDRLLEPGFSLVHITGYVQPKHEWLDLVWSGEFNYHRIELEENSLEVSIKGKCSTVQGRGIFNASINGTTAPWRLRFALELNKHEGVWMIASARYTTF